MPARTKEARWESGARALAILCACWLASPATADVLEIGADGVTAVRTGAGAVHWAGGAADGAGRTTEVEIPSDLELSPAAVALSGWQPPAAYAGTVARIAARYGLSPALIEAVAWHESRWQPGAVSRVGAIGLTQLMPATARALGVDPHDPSANLEGGARFLRQMLDLFDGDVEKALAAYDAGPARVLKAGGVPAIAETRAYVQAVLARLASTPKGE